MKRITCRIKPYIQPFEIRLALAELSAIAGGKPHPVCESSGQEHEFSVECRVPPIILAERLAYWETINSEEPRLTTQVLREATVNMARNTITFEDLTKSLPFNGNVSLPNRRCLRYGTHGLHEYRGKFFPQLVRSLINIAGINGTGIVADPMCGSGTTLVEAVLSGCSGVGIDMNPLSVLISRTKCSLLSTEPGDLISCYEQLQNRVLKRRKSPSLSMHHFSSLPSVDQEYLRRWFSPRVLADLDQIATSIMEVRAGPVRDLLFIILSNILRRVSWQKEDDLRVRKQMVLDREIDPIREFLEKLRHSVSVVIAFLCQNKKMTLGSFSVEEADARHALETWSTCRGKVDAVITSPPYATALPYLDTDRLSLIYLRLLSRPLHRKRDQEMIGNREINSRRKEAYWQTFKKRCSEIPESVTQLIEEIDTFNRKVEVGFRRKNLPSLLAKYFLDMHTVLMNIHSLLKPGAPAYIVIGNNHTIAGGRRVEIRTGDLLLETARRIGFKIGETIPMEMLVSRDIFRKNAVASECILCMTK